MSPGLARHNVLLAFGVVLMVLLMAALATGLQSEAALAKCEPNRSPASGTYFDGWKRVPGQNVYGAAARIFNYSPWVYPGSVVTAFSMFNYGLDRWAQVGWVEFPYDSRWTYAQWKDSSGTTQTHYYPPQPLNSYSYYTVVYNQSLGKFYFYIAGSLVDTANASFAPNAARVSGETHNLKDQMPGGYNYKEDFFDSQLFYGGWWQPLDGTKINYSDAYYGWERISSTYLRIWDKACAN